MRHPSHDPDCGICQMVARESEILGGVVFENDLWMLLHHPPPYGVPGWMLLLTKRHVQGPAHFSDEEAANFGPALRHFERVLEEVTGALRVYTAAMGESVPHFHGHMVPRYAQTPNDVRSWNVFDLERATIAGEVTVDADEVARITEAYRRALAENPPPR